MKVALSVDEKVVLKVSGMVAKSAALKVVALVV
jgi:hypothetical protein